MTENIRGSAVSEWIKLERLPSNDLPLPKYETKNSAGIDFGACLKRPCIKVGPKKNKQYFLPDWERSSYCGGYNHHSKQLSSPEDWEPKEYDWKPILTIEPNELVMVPLGFKSEFGFNYVLHLHVRSSVGLMGLILANGTGIIDPDYRGELFAAILNRSQEQVVIEHGDRIVQGVLLGFNQAIVIEKEVDATERGEGGFGSTGLK